MKIKDIRLEPVENGYKISYCEMSKKDNKNTFDNYSYNYKELVFKEDEADKAMAKFSELSKLSKGKEYQEEKLMEMEMED